MHSLIPHWIESLDVHHFAVNIRELNEPYPWSIYPNSDPMDMHGFNTLEPLCKSLRPELILVSNNLWYFPLIAPKLRSWSPKSKIVVYFPIEGDRVRPPQVRSLALADLAVTFTPFALDTLKAHPDAPDLQHLIDLQHGLDHDVFYPLIQKDGIPDLEHSKLVARELFLPSYLQGSKPFIVLNSNRNQGSKRIDLTLKGFELFARNKPDNVFLYLNMAKRDEAENMWNEAQRLGIENRVIFSRDTRDCTAFSTQELNMLYNACDVGVNTSMGEGWGLVSFEHAATGRPQIVPGHSACKCLWDGHAEVLNPPAGQSQYVTALSNTAIDPHDLAESLEKLYTDKDHYRKQALSAWEYVSDSAFSWKNIAESWEGRFWELLR